ncbi:MAG: ParA family protein [Myxococcota bacterium]|nr:ParA family protein [Myxococcota bacterium]
MSYTATKIVQIFGNTSHKNTLLQAEGKIIPAATRERRGKVSARVWQVQDLPKIGKHYGWLPNNLEEPVALSVFSSKGGSYKTTLATTLARSAALNAIPTCLVGLDYQMDATRFFGFDSQIEDNNEDLDLEDLSTQLVEFKGLHDFYSSPTKTSLSDIIQPVDDFGGMLSIVPESSKLSSLDMQLASQTLREFWLRDNIINPLKERFKLIIIDCSPSWNLLTANALAASDLMVSPLECQINHWRGFTDFQTYITNFRAKIGLNYPVVYVPTKLDTRRKISSQIHRWYLNEIGPACTTTAIKNSSKIEEAAASGLSIFEHAPLAPASTMFRDLTLEIWNYLPAQNPGKQRRDN